MFVRTSSWRRSLREVANRTQELRQGEWENGGRRELRREKHERGGIKKTEGD